MELVPTNLTLVFISRNFGINFAACTEEQIQTFSSVITTFSARELTFCNRDTPFCIWEWTFHTRDTPFCTRDKHFCQEYALLYKDTTCTMDTPGMKPFVPGIHPSVKDTPFCTRDETFCTRDTPIMYPRHTFLNQRYHSPHGIYPSVSRIQWFSIPRCRNPMVTHVTINSSTFLPFFH